MRLKRHHDIPEELRRLPNWVVWRLEKRVDTHGVVSKTKVPYNARSGKYAKSNDPSTWSSFDEALAAFERGGYDGPGFCLTSPYVGIDLDGCHDPGGVIEPWAEEIIRELDSYSELSPSGTGVRVIVKGDLPDGGRQKEFGDRPHHGIGLYDAARGRYLTMTGERIGGNGTIAERTAELHRIHARLFPPQAKAKGKAQAEAGPADVPDDDLIERARNAKDKGKFDRLWDGQWESDYPSQSEADLALCAKLAFWTGCDAPRMDTLFRRSSLMREKWERGDYRKATIAKAIKQTPDTWRPKREEEKETVIDDCRPD
jgi:primase-polymerase (primpol)-like protein